MGIYIPDRDADSAAPARPEILEKSSTPRRTHTLHPADRRAAAGYDGGQLQQRDGVDHAVSGSKTFMGLAEPIQQYAIFSHAIQNAVSADNRGVHGARENQDA